jgi:zinc/manganese transport system permease protein
MHLLADAFIQHALIAGVPIAAAAGLAGYFLVLRSQVFSGDALSHVAFTGALGALALGLDPVIGLFAATILTGMVLAVIGGRGQSADVAIGTTFAWVLGLGVLALSVYATGGAGSNGTSGADGAAGVRVLFGSIFGLDRGRAVTAAAISAGVVLVLLLMARPLLFASLDPQVARSRGVPVRALGVVFLGAVGATAGVATQAIGALLIVGLLAAPAGAARHLTDRPYVAMAWSTSLAVLSMTAGILASDVLPRVPPSFAILAVASLCYLVSYLAAHLTVHRTGDRRRKGPAPEGTGPFRAVGTAGTSETARQCVASALKNAGPFGEPTPVSLS